MRFSILDGWVVLRIFFLVDEYLSTECDYSLSYEDYDDCLAMQKQCKTVDGKTCIFPFQFRGEEKTNCITSRQPKRTRPWCPTQINASTKVPIVGQWGYCEDQCLTKVTGNAAYYLLI